MYYKSFQSLTLTRGQCKYLPNTLMQPCVNVLSCGSVNTKTIHRVIKSLCSLSSFHPRTLLSVITIKEGNFIKSGNEMQKVSI
jgi:hypothetical protein